MTRTNRKTWAVAVAAVAALAVAPAASAYELPANPGTLTKPTKKIKKLNVCKVCTGVASPKYSTIQAAVNASKQTSHKYEYTITVYPGTYAESVTVEGHQLDGLTIQGSSTDAKKVKIDLSTLTGDAKKNAMTINATSGVTVKNLTVTHYGENGLWFVNVGVPKAYVSSIDPINVMNPKAKMGKAELFGKNAYTVDNVIASFGGRYGIFARTSVGGTIKNSEAYYNDDSGFYIGETPPQTTPVRTYITNVKSWGNVLGYSGTNSRYVTISASKWWNNGMGIVPNITMGEHWPAPAFNQYKNNDIYGNNFNYYGSVARDGSNNPIFSGGHVTYTQEAPFPTSSGQLGGGASYPVGIGMLLFGSQDSEVSGNRFWGNKLAGFAMINPSVLLKDSGNWKALCGADNKSTSADCVALQTAATLRRNKVFGNAFGRLGLNRNGRDIAYANDGLGNCIGGTGSYANTVGGSQTKLVELGRNADPAKGWQACNPTGTGVNKYSAAFAGSLTTAYFEMLTYADNTATSGPVDATTDPTGQSVVDNLSFEGRWYVWPGTESSWPSQYGKPLEHCHITAPYQGCDGQTDGKP